MNSSSSRRTSLRARLRATTEATLLDAAEEGAAREGLEAASLQAIAERAGGAVGTIYNYFADRDALVEALFVSRRAELAAEVDATASNTADAPFEAQLHAFVENLLEFFARRRSFLRGLIDAEHVRARPVAARARRGSALEHIRARAARLVAAGVAAGDLRPERQALYADALVSLVRGILVGRAADAEPLARNAAAVVDIFLHGTAAR